MSRKSVLLATLLAGMSAFTGCDEKKEKSVPQEAQIQHFEKMAASVPIFLDELPHAMILPNGKAGYVQMLYPVKRNGVVLESKEQYEKRIKWLNEKYPINIPQPSLTLQGCKWVDCPHPPKLPYVSIFDKKEYIYHHISWMKGFYKPGNQFNFNYSPEKDPFVLWWVAQTEFASKGKTSSSVKKAQKEY